MFAKAMALLNAHKIVATSERLSILKAILRTPEQFNAKSLLKAVNSVGEEPPEHVIDKSTVHRALAVFKKADLVVATNKTNHATNYCFNAQALNALIKD